MTFRFSIQNDDFEIQFQKLLKIKRETNQDVNLVVADIISNIQTYGDTALFDYTTRFDHFDAREHGLRFSAADIVKATNHIDAQTLSALELAAERITTHHQRQKPQDDRYHDGLGIELGSKWTALESVGLYVPGGKASYPSSVLMNAIPAKVAGVDRIAMVVPAPKGEINPLVLAAAHIVGIDEIYRIGGAQAIAALAYGTKTIVPVAKIVGPGNAYVAAAKRQVFGHVGIDMIAGPSEILVLADKQANPNWIAADLLAQAEHDQAAQSILITDSAEVADAVALAVEQQLEILERRTIASESWQEYGAIIIVNHLDEAVPLIDRIAPEHLAIALLDPEPYLAKIRNAGAIFLGYHTPEAIGDYIGGSNHVLPTARSARFSSGLSVLDFVKRTSILKCNKAGLQALAPAVLALAGSEGLQGHARSVSIRLDEDTAIPPKNDDHFR